MIRLPIIAAMIVRKTIGLRIRTIVNGSKWPTNNLREVNMTYDARFLPIYIIYYIIY